MILLALTSVQVQWDTFKTVPNFPSQANAGGQLVTLWIDGREIHGPQGQTLGATLLAHEIRVLRHSPLRQEPRGLFCAIGVCFECLVTVDGQPAQRACQVRVREGMVVELGRLPE